MSKKKVPLTEEEIEKISSRYLTGLGVVGIASLVAINFFPTILISMGITAGFCSVAAITTKQIEKLNDRKKDSK